MNTHIRNLLDKYEEQGYAHLHSGRYQLAGYNYAKDILAAIAYARKSLTSCIELNNVELEQQLEKIKITFEQQNADREGLGVGTLTDMINEIKANGH